MLVPIVQVHRYKRGDTIFWQGDAGIGFFIVKTGRVKVFKLAKDGKEQILHLFGPRDHFAEVPALDGKPFPASAAAIETTELILFPRLAFLDLLYQQPTIAINLLLSFARHLRRFSGLVEELTLKEVPERLATYLIQLSDRTNNSHTVELDMSKGQLAALLGTIPATLSRALYRLSSEGIIAIDGARIELRDRDRLEALGKPESVD